MDLARRSSAGGAGRGTHRVGVGARVGAGHVDGDEERAHQEPGEDVGRPLPRELPRHRHPCPGSPLLPEVVSPFVCGHRTGSVGFGLWVPQLVWEMLSCLYK